ncbi:NUDIX domain-containing protein [Nocardia fluminea]|uniref:8-oxo-dGTP diphosphatase n=1 Tax=Nocardia fluminea TaxID=134984 RepID=A0A2N3VBP5_9NOCA|nr:NUDIX domain-containing protein [Nocardia fluminea]PKV79037.1 8-oxo-dGTP diphosphatase [Nocardia fluminea]
MRGDGDGWYKGPGGVKHWGKFGAAGLLLRAPLPGGGSAVLLQHRAPWSHQGGTWALPGGARDSHESPEHAAVREAEEEAGIAADDLRVRAERLTMTAPSGWTYITVIADADKPLPTVANRESAELAWVPEDEVADLPLHPGFAAAWIELRAVPLRVRLDADTELADALPRTVELPDQGFFWLHARDDGPGAEVVVDGEPAGGPVLTRADVLA